MDLRLVGVTNNIFFIISSVCYFFTTTEHFKILLYFACLDICEESWRFIPYFTDEEVGTVSYLLAHCGPTVHPSTFFTVLCLLPALFGAFLGFFETISL